MRCHYRVSKGWMSAPCGISHFKGKYHIFYQHNPDAPRWGYMHWGHCVTEDFITYEELPVALTPEEGGSYLGGSSIVADGRLYLFYTLDNTIISAVSEDGIHFEDTEFDSVTGNYDYLMDPHVFEYDGRYLMAVGTGRHNIAGIALYESTDLVAWRFVNDIVTDPRFGSHIESPNLFRTEDRWCLMFTSARQLPSRNICAMGKFDGNVFEMDGEYMSVESGPDLYNPYVLSEGKRNIMIGWFYDRKATSGASKGMLTCAREVLLNKAGDLVIVPAAELFDNRMITAESSFVSYDNGRLRIMFEKKTVFDKPYRSVPDVITVEDVGTVETFINGGSENITITVC
ncbi:beta-fructofuranosidase [Ruminococcaceae bacterium YRB3002]|nr:beta-fructofuranosidase [Ruminococcaceae bacterium YRB3002]